MKKNDLNKVIKLAEIKLEALKQIKKNKIKITKNTALLVNTKTLEYKVGKFRDNDEGDTYFFKPFNEPKIVLEFGMPYEIAFIHQIIDEATIFIISCR